MKKILYLLFFLSLYVIVSSCSFIGDDKNQKEWITTKEGHKFWGTRINDKAIYTWDGGSISSLINGKGKLSVYANNGEYSDTTFTSKSGSMTDSDWKNTPDGLFLGHLENNLPSGFGVLKQNDSLLLIGVYKEGVIKDSEVEIIKNGVPEYVGHMKDNKYSGTGKLYENGKLIYVGSFEEGEFNGNGILYKNGQAKKGRWSKGLYEESLINRTIKQAKEQYNTIFNKEANEKTEVEQEETEIIFDYSSLERESFVVDTLYENIQEYVNSHIKEAIDNRFDFINLPRMLWQKFFTANGDRKSYAEQYFMEKLNSDELKDMLNEKINWFNQSSDSEKINVLSEIPINKNIIIDVNVFNKIQERETLELSDFILDSIFEKIVIQIIFCFIFGLFFSPSVCLIVGNIFGFIANIIFSIYTTGSAMVFVEEEILQMISSNIMNEISNQSLLLNLLF